MEKNLMKNDQWVRERYTDKTPYLEEHIRFLMDVGEKPEILDVQCDFTLLAGSSANLPDQLSGKLEYLGGEGQYQVMLTLDQNLPRDTVTESWLVGDVRERNQALLHITPLSAMPRLKELLKDGGIHLHEILAQRETMASTLDREVGGVYA